MTSKALQAFRQTHKHLRCRIRAPQSRYCRRYCETSGSVGDDILSSDGARICSPGCLRLPSRCRQSLDASDSISPSLSPNVGWKFARRSRDYRRVQPDVLELRGGGEGRGAQIRRAASGAICASNGAHTTTIRRPRRRPTGAHKCRTWVR